MISTFPQPSQPLQPSEPPPTDQSPNSASMSYYVPAIWIDYVLQVMVTDDFERCCCIHTISTHEISLVTRQMRRRIPSYHAECGTIHLTKAQLRETRITKLNLAVRFLWDAGQYLQYGIPNSRQWTAHPLPRRNVEAIGDQ